MKSIFSVVTLFLISTQVQASGCWQKQSFVVAGQTISTDQCMQNVKMNEVEFKKVCNIGAEGIPGMVPPMKITFLDKCPTKAENECVGFGQGNYTSYYYNKGDVADRKRGCEMVGGKFK